jgi:secretion/DNA translocation related CpaE-like protein
MPTADQRAGRRRTPAIDEDDWLRPEAGPASDHPLVLTADIELLDSVLAATAAAGAEPTVSDSTAAIRSLWSAAPMVVIGADRARGVAELLLPHRTEVYVVGPESRLAEMSAWSAPLGAAVIGMPDGAGTLTAAVSDVIGRGSGTGRLVTLVGGSGGIGTSSLAAALAVGAASRGLPAMLVDLDVLGGGIYLLVGAEGVAGWRWPRLGAAQGHLGDLTGHLPRLGGLDILSTARGEGPDTLSPEAVRAVLSSATRSHRVVVVDLPRSPAPAVVEALRRSTATLLVVSADVRGIAAGRVTAASLRDLTTVLALIVRRPRGGAIDAEVVAESVGVPLAGAVGTDATLRHGSERGDPPGRLPRSPLGRLSSRLLDRLLDEGGSL